MSLINDALRKAKQQTAQPGPGLNLQLRPMDPSHEKPANSGLLLLAVFVAGLILAGAMVPLLFGNRKMQSAAIVVHPGSSASPSSIVAEPVPAAVSAQLPNTITRETTTGVMQSSSPDVPAALPPPVLKALPLKLQGILFNASRPSAIINGKTVEVGNQVGEFRVVSISQSAAVLVSSTETNILEFEE